VVLPPATISTSLRDARAGTNARNAHQIHSDGASLDWGGQPGSGVIGQPGLEIGDRAELQQSEGECFRLRERQRLHQEPEFSI
jgi:hypothetical protein